MTMAKETRPQIATVQVALRIRPLTHQDRAQPRFAGLTESQILRVQEKSVHVVPQAKVFNFDHVFPPQCSQKEVFSVLGEKLVHKFVEGYNVTILAYGQTSSGKTYTMGTTQCSNSEQEGIVPRAATLLFELLQQNDNCTVSPSSSSSTSIPSFPKGGSSRMRPPSRILSPRPSQPPTSSKFKYAVKVSFIEIYNEELVDLLNDSPPSERPPITIREDTRGHIYWTGVREVAVQSMQDVIAYLKQGTQNRATGSTDMNEKSSRSHAIFSITLKQEKWVANSRPSTPNPAKSPGLTRSGGGGQSGARISEGRQEEDGEWLITSSKFHFVDLAGSERLKRTAAEGDRRKEGININAGLLALGNVISVLGDPSKRGTHIPYRDSKLTRLLQDSLGGNATTLMIACVSPTESNLPETMNTLQYANRARNIKNKVEKNEVEEWMTTENLDLLRNTISNLKAEVRALKSNQDKSRPASSATSHDSLEWSLSDVDLDPLYQEQQQTIADLQRQIEELDGEATVTRERNRVVEEELKRLRQQASHEVNKEDVDFQHFVEPVIEEYEKTIAGLESQLATTRAALSHSELRLQEQETKLDQFKILTEDQEQKIKQLQDTLSSMAKRERGNEVYVRELEKKIEKMAKDIVNDEEVVNELRGRIQKFKETDEKTEKYIVDLEQRLAIAEHAKEQLQQQLIAMTQSMLENQQMVNDLRARLDKSESEKIASALVQTTSQSEERKTLYQQIARLQENVAALQSQSNEREAATEKSLNAMRDHLARVQQDKDAAAKEYVSQITTLQDTLARVQSELEMATNGSHRRTQETTVQQLGISQHTPGKDQQSSLSVDASSATQNGVHFDTENSPSTPVTGHFQETAHLPPESNHPHIPNHNQSTQLHTQYKQLINCYNEQAERLATALTKTKNMQKSKADSGSRKNAIVMRRVFELEKQLAKQQAKVQSETTKFQADAQEWLNQEDEANLLACFTKVEQDLITVRTVVSNLETKLQKTEMALGGLQATSQKSDTVKPDKDMEELQTRMDAMIIVPEEDSKQRGES